MDVELAEQSPGLKEDLHGLKDHHRSRKDEAVLARFGKRQQLRVSPPGGICSNDSFISQSLKAARRDTKDRC